MSKISAISMKSVQNTDAIKKYSKLYLENKLKLRE